VSRHGYSDDFSDLWELIRYRGQVASAIRGARGQRFLRELAAALDAMPEKRLVAQDLVTNSGEVCAIGALGRAKGIDLSDTDPSDHDGLAATFDVAKQLVAEVEYLNDESVYLAGTMPDRPEVRWRMVRAWVGNNIQEQS
jgi:hypothetical protein